LFSDHLNPVIYSSSEFSTSSKCLDYYSDLELDEGANTKSIKEAYYKLSKQYHPDLNADNPDALRKFQVRY
jgi:DnaJ-class molecular chaperone